MSYIIKREPTVQNIESLQEQINNLEGNTFQQQIDDINADLTIMQTDIQALQTNDTIQDNDINQLQTDVLNIQLEQTQQNVDISTLQSQITTLTLNNSLTDVDITGLVANKILKYDGLKWVVSDDSNGIADVPNDSQNYI